MAPTDESNAFNANAKVTQVREQQHSVDARPANGATPDDGSQNPNNRATLSDAVSSIKKDDFINIANAPCSRNGLLTGIASGAGLGGLKFVVSGNASKSANWAVGIFLIGSVASYEYCQFKRRAERSKMQRTIEVVNANNREKAKAAADKRVEEQKAEEERKTRQRPWYKVW